VDATDGISSDNKSWKYVLRPNPTLPRRLLYLAFIEMYRLLNNKLKEFREKSSVLLMKKLQQVPIKFYDISFLRMRVNNIFSSCNIKDIAKYNYI
jgi:hypothetical protein